MKQHFAVELVCIDFFLTRPDFLFYEINFDNVDQITSSLCKSCLAKWTELIEELHRVKSINFMAYNKDVNPSRIVHTKSKEFKPALSNALFPSYLLFTAYPSISTLRMHI